MSSDNIFTAKIVPLTGGPEVEVISEPPVRRHDHLARQDDHNLRAHYLLARGPDTSSGINTVLRNVVGTPSVVGGSYANGMQVQQQTQLLERVTNLEAELARTKQEIAQLKELNTLLQQGLPDVICRTLREELRKPRWSAANPQDSTFPQGQASSKRQRGGATSSQKRHKSGPTQRAVLKARDTPAKMTKKLLTTIFDRETLAMSTLTGRGGKSKTLTKAQLDPAMVKTIVDKVTTTFGISECSVRIIISQKCKEEMMIRRRRLGLDSKPAVINKST